MEALRGWIAAPHLSGGAFFRRLRKANVGNHMLDVCSFGRMLKRRREEITYCADKSVSGHSFRLGGVQKLYWKEKSGVEMMVKWGGIIWNLG